MSDSHLTLHLHLHPVQGAERHRCGWLQDGASWSQALVLPLLPWPQGEALPVTHRSMLDLLARCCTETQPQEA